MEKLVPHKTLYDDYRVAVVGAGEICMILKYKKYKKQKYKQTDLFMSNDIHRFYE